MTYVQAACLHRRGAVVLASALLFVCTVFAGPTLADEDAPSLEYQIKASYIFNFAKFVEWPEGPSGSAGPDTLNMCFFEADNFGNALTKLHGQKLGEKTISILRPDLAREQPIANCNLVFLGEGLSDRQDALLAAAMEQPTLTIGESRDFLESGGIFEFVRKRGKILFRISARNAKAAKLIIDPQLLGLAIEVQ